MKTSNKIILGFIFIALMNITPAFVRLNSMQQTQEHLNLIIESNLSEHEGISQLAYYLQRAKSNIRELLLEIHGGRDSVSERENARKVIIECISGLENNLTLLKEATMMGKELHSLSENQNSDIEISKVAEIEANLNKFITGAKEFTMVAKDSNDEKFFLGVFVNIVEPLSRTLQKQIDEFKTEETEETRHEINSIAEHIMDIRNYVVICSILTFMATVIFAYFFARNISNSRKNK